MFYAIDENNQVSRAAEGEAIKRMEAVVREETDLRDFPLKRLVEIHNELAERPVKRFKDKSAAARRVWQVMETSDRVVDLEPQEPRETTDQDRKADMVRTTESQLTGDHNPVTEASEEGKPRVQETVSGKVRAVLEKNRGQWVSGQAIASAAGVSLESAQIYVSIFRNPRKTKSPLNIQKWRIEGRVHYWLAG